MNFFSNLLFFLFILNFSVECFSADSTPILNLTAISSSKAVLQWNLPDASSCTLSYGTNPWDLEYKIISTEKQYKHQVILTNLKSNSRYFCQTYYFNNFEKIIKKIPPTPLQIKTLARDNDRNTLNILSSDIIAQSDTIVLIKILLSEPSILEIRYGTEKRNLKNKKKYDFFNKTHFILLNNIDDLEKNYYSVSAENIFKHNISLKEPKIMKIEKPINIEYIPEEYKNIFIKDEKSDDRHTERGMRSRTRRRH